MKSNFNFLTALWPQIQVSAHAAEQDSHSAPRTSIFYARFALEQAIGWLFDNDDSLSTPYERSLSAMMHEPSFKERLLPPNLFPSINLIRKVGNQAVHPGSRVDAQTAIAVARNLHLFLSWFARLFSESPVTILSFDPTLIPQRGAAEQTAAQLDKLRKELDEKERAYREQQVKMSEEVARYRNEIQQLKSKNQKSAAESIVQTDHTEDETRDLFIDVMLREAGWNPHGDNVREYEVTGMPNAQNLGYCDYVLWGDNGLPLAVVEAKRTKKSPKQGEHQAELYANSLEKMTGQRPIIFYSNGYETWLWDDKFYAPRKVSGFYTKAELQLLINRRSDRTDIQKAPINKNIVERPYQEEAIRRITDAFTKKQRRCLLAMSMGTGKTRVSVAISELLMQAGWVKRVLFLADRNALVRQARNAFIEHLPSASCINLIEEKENPNTRVVISTYPTMMNAIDEKENDGVSLFSPGHFDLIFLDEVHRSIYKRYGAIFEYFDSLIIGLTATPRDEVSKNTYHFLDLEPGVPTFAYDLDQAVSDNFLVPPRAAVVNIRFQREGIRYKDLTGEEQEEYEEKFYDEETGTMPPEIESSALNSWVFNEDTVDKVLGHLMTNGIRVAGNERLGKTIIFAKNHEHAEFIRMRFDKNFPELAGKFLRVIDNQVNYAQTLIEDFGQKDKDPHIAVSVDMLDTGIDIPEVVNLVFFKIVRSRVKFWQMIGRGTRLCKNLFGPGKDKQHFLIFDFCGNLEFFDAHPKGIETPSQDSLSQKIFKHRLTLVLEIRKGPHKNDPEYKTMAEQLADALHRDLCVLNPNSLLVRPRQKYFRPFLDRKRLDGLSEVDVADLTDHVSDLVTHPYEEEYAKRFDVLTHSLEIAMALGTPRLESLKNLIREMAAGLELKKNIPAVNNSLKIIQSLQDDSFWAGATLPAIERVREELRGLVKLLDHEAGRDRVFTDFTDQIVGVTERDDLVKTEPGLRNYRAKVEKFIRELESLDTTIYRLKHNRPITSRDIEHLEKLLFEKLGTRADYEKERGKEPLGRFVRSIVGLDRGAAKEAFSDFLSSDNFSADQIAFVNRVIDYLTQNGVVDPGILFEQPFTDINSKGVTGLFASKQVASILNVLKQVAQNADAA